jgi:hypothetical protein
MHWSPWRALGFGVICNVVGAALYAGYRVFTQEHLLQPFSGTDAMLAGFLGAFVAMHMEHPVNMWLYLPKRGWVATQIPALALPVFWFLASVPLYLWGKPPHYLPAFGMNLLVLLAGWQAAKTLDVQWRRHTAPDASTRHAPSQAERSRSGEASLKDAWALMEKYDMDNALKQFKNGIQILLQDPETNRQTIENAFAKLAKESLQLPLQPMESFELAQRLESAQCYNASIHLLEKLIKMHPPESIRRHALYSIASQRIDHNIEPHLAKPYVEEILKSGDDDIIARRARTFLT